MTFAAKMMLYSAAASAMLAASPVLLTAEPVKLEFSSVAADSGKAADLWGDVLPNVVMQGEDAPSVFVADAGEGLEVSVLYASNQCSLSDCPVRAFRGGEKVADEMGCINLAEYTVAESRTAMAACGEVFIFKAK